MTHGNKRITNVALYTIKEQKIILKNEINRKTKQKMDTRLFVGMQECKKGTVCYVVYYKRRELFFRISTIPILFYGLVTRPILVKVWMNLTHCPNCTRNVIHFNDTHTRTHTHK